MHSAKQILLASVTAVAATFAFASAGNAGGISDCVHMAKQVAKAMDTAQPGKATDDARTQANAGRSYCASQMYERGVEHYAKALELLNAKS